jgi:hypothetical protein
MSRGPAFTGLKLATLEGNVADKIAEMPGVAPLCGLQRGTNQPEQIIVGTTQKNWTTFAAPTAVFA